MHTLYEILLVSAGIVVFTLLMRKAAAGIQISLGQRFVNWMKQRGIRHAAQAAAAESALKVYREHLRRSEQDRREMECDQCWAEVGR